MKISVKPEVAGNQDPRIISKSFVGRVSYAMGAIASWFGVRLAFPIYLLTPLFFITPPRHKKA